MRTHAQETLWDQTNRSLSSSFLWTMTETGDQKRTGAVPLAVDDSPDYLEWDLVNGTHPDGYDDNDDDKDVFDRCCVPKTMAWLSFYVKETKQLRIAVVEGYNVANASPPILMIASDTIPLEAIRAIQAGHRVTLSVTTTREGAALSVLHRLRRQQQTNRNHYSFSDLGLEPYSTTTTTSAYPDAVALSPIHMHCSLEAFVPLSSSSSSTSTTNKDNQQQQQDQKGDHPSPCATAEMLLLLKVDNWLLRGEILSRPPTPPEGGREVLALVDAAKIRPVCSLGWKDGFCTIRQTHAMLRPRQVDNLEDVAQGWTSDAFVVKTRIDDKEQQEQAEFADYVYDPSDAESTQRFGYNPCKAIVMPRPIGWISTFPTTSATEGDERIGHVAPFSFFAQLSKTDTPLVAFSSYRTEQGTRKKDAQLDVETTGCFCVNMVSERNAVAMNMTSSSVGRRGDEFVVGDIQMDRTDPTTTGIDAPFVQDTPVLLQCRYTQTVDVASFSIVVGRVERIRIDSRFINTNDNDDDKPFLDIARMKPVTRLGYTDEYAVVDEMIAP